MRILKPGDPDKKHTTLFVCDECGCEFEADRGEYQVFPSTLVKFIGTCRCPTCRGICFAIRGIDFEG